MADLLDTGHCRLIKLLVVVVEFEFIEHHTKSQAFVCRAGGSDNILSPEDRHGFRRPCEGQGVHSVNYDLDYYEKMLREYSATAEEIAQIRWGWISDKPIRTVLDYGSGVGWFRAWRPPGVECDTYDIGAYPQTGTQLKIYDVICFWDTLEHIPDFSLIEPVLALSRSVAVTLPILTEGLPLHDWKHCKPGEHLHYFTAETLSALFARYGFTELVKSGQPECPPREDVWTFLYRRTA